MKGDEKRGTLCFLDKQTKDPETQKPRAATSVRARLSPAAWAVVLQKWLVSWLCVIVGGQPESLLCHCDFFKS